MSELQHTIWLWLEGVFPRRIAYWLLMKDLTPSVADLLAGKTTKANLTIIPVHRQIPTGWRVDGSAEPQPEGAANPCMRVTDPSNGTSRFIYESTSILLYLEELFPDPPMQAKDMVERGRTLDLIEQINLVAIDTNYKLRNIIPEHGMIMGLAPENQSQAAAENAESQEKKGYLKLQAWAKEYDCLEKTGWLTPGIEGPGVVDFALVPNVRFVELVWGIDTFTDPELKPLADWYERFKCLPFWEAFEERDGALPSGLDFGKKSRAAWMSKNM